MRFPFEFRKYQRIIHFLWWDADNDLAQATWEWPLRQRAETAFAAVADREARFMNLDWKRRGKKEFARQIYQ